MLEKNFAEMSKEELQAYCKKIANELSIAQWFLRNKIQQEQDAKGKVS
ncbi:MAG: hypothetical protein ACI4UX_05360 [Clostridia bacterium]